MPKIYKSFEELEESMDLHLCTPEFYAAKHVWDARQAEIDELKEEIEILKEGQQEIAAYYKACIDQLTKKKTDEEPGK